MRLDALLYEIVVLGEAARRLSPEVRAAYPDIPWSEIIGMGSVITHGYDQIDDDELWEVIERDCYGYFGVVSFLPNCRTRVVFCSQIAAVVS
jgi:uncharacterized protein with HEPN domain